MKIPEGLRQTILNNNGQDGEAWLKSFPSLLQKYLKMWDLTLEEEFEDLTFNFVVAVHLRDGSPAVLKLGPHARGLARQAQTLKIYDGAGAAKILDYSAQDGVLLIERITPGENLRNLISQNKINDQQATEVAAKVMLKLIQNQKVKLMEEVTSVSVWGLGFEKFLRENCRGLEFPIDKINRADKIYKELMGTTKSEKVLHGDLHHSNILQGTREAWLAIDPKGVRGDPAFEVGAFMRNPYPEITNEKEIEEILLSRFRIFQSVLKFEVKRMWGWSYAQCVLAAIWTAEDRQQDWRQWLKVALAFERIEDRIR